jgi:hypothetical protein
MDLVWMTERAELKVRRKRAGLCKRETCRADRAELS